MQRYGRLIESHIHGVSITSAMETWDAPYVPGASTLTDEELEKLRTGEHPHDIDLEDFHHLPAPLLEIPRTMKRHLFPFAQ